MRLRERGVTLIEILIALGVGAILLTFAMFPIVTSMKARNQVQTLGWLDQKRTELLKTLQDDLAWQNILNHAAENPTMACLGNPLTGIPPTSCAAFRDTQERVTVFDKFDKVLNDSRNLAAGFTPRGEPCGTYDAIAGSDECPYRITVSWTALCRTDCVAPEVRLQASFFYRPGPTTDTQFNANKFTFRLYRGPNAANVQQTCTEQNGVYTGPTVDALGNILADATCVMGSVGACPAGQAIVGFTNDNLPQCGSVNQTYSCPGPSDPSNWTFFRGVDAAGNQVCTPCN